MAKNDLQELWKYVANLDKRTAILENENISRDKNIESQTTLIGGLQEARAKSGNYTIAALVTIIISLFGLLMTIIINSPQK